MTERGDASCRGTLFLRAGGALARQVSCFCTGVTSRHTAVHILLCAREAPSRCAENVGYFITAKWTTFSSNLSGSSGRDGAGQGGVGRGGSCVDVLVATGGKGLTDPRLSQDFTSHL